MGIARVTDAFLSQPLTLNAGVLVVELSLDNLLLSLAHRREYIGLHNTDKKRPSIPILHHRHENYTEDCVLASFLPCPCRHGKHRHPG